MSGTVMCWKMRLCTLRVSNQKLWNHLRALVSEPLISTALGKAARNAAEITFRAGRQHQVTLPFWPSSLSNVTVF
jgi:hypothetical protein